MRYAILFFLLLSTGFDILAIPTPVGSVRLSFFLFLLAFLVLFLTKGIRVSKIEIFFLLFLVISMFFSTLISSSAIRSFSYIIWFSVCYFLYFSVIKNLVSDLSSNEILRVFRDLGRFQILCCMLLKFSGIPRPSLLFYEPSYLILGLLPYIYFSLLQIQLKNGVFKSIDLFLVLILIALTMSANLLLAIILILAFLYIRFSLKYLIFLAVLVLSSYYFSLWYYQNNADLLAITFRNLHESPDFISTILQRTGNRWPRILIGIDVVKEYFPKGIGLGTFSEFSVNYNVNKDYAAGFPWNEPRGFPAANVFIELLAEGGVFVFFISFVCLFMFMPLKSSADEFIASHWRKMMFIFILMLMIESSLLRPYFWAYLGILSNFLAFKGKKKLQEGVDEKNNY